MEWIAKIIEIIKLPIKFIIGIAVFSGSLFILPNDLLTKFKLDSFLNDFGAFIGIAFYGATILIIVNIIYFLISKIQNKYSERKQKITVENQNKILENKILQKLNSLDPHEKAVLREFIIQAKNTIELPIDHHVVTGLINAGILEVVSQYLTRNIIIGILTSVSLSEVAQNHIYNNIDIIEFPNGEPTEEEKNRILSQRPDFVRQIERFNDLYRR